MRRIHPIVDSRRHRIGDEGGNTLSLILRQSGSHATQHAAPKLHHYWDEEAVVTALDQARTKMRAEQGANGGRIQEDEIADWLASHERPV